MRTGRKGRPKKIFVVEPTQIVNKVEEINKDPSTVEEAMQSSNANDWRKAMREEYESLMRKSTWELVERPDGKNTVGCKWVFVTKRDPSGNIVKHKARLVAQGFSQKFRIDYNETYSPVVRFTAIRMLFAVAAVRKMLVNHIDIVSAYLNGELKEEVYMRQPPMFIDQNIPNGVCKLKKSIYGLKQAGRDWYRKINQILLDLNFVRCKTDSCLYVLHKEEELVMLAIYVDDILLACSEENTLSEVVLSLNKYVDAIDRGPVNYYLGMEIKRDGPRGNISVHQSSYTEELIREWNMEQCKPLFTPFVAGTVLEACKEDNCHGFDVKIYQSLIGSLTYLSAASRPDISHIVSKLSQFNSHPHKEHFVAAKNVLRYLKQNPKGTLSFSSSNDLVCYTDADWGSNVVDRKSFSGFVIFLAGGPITWESKKQKIVALSSMEAEYIAMCQGTKEVVYIRSLLAEIGLHEFIQSATTIRCDNQSAQFMVENPVAHKRSKHIDIRYHYIREKFENKDIVLEYVSSDTNIADVFTKCLTKEKHVKFSKMLFQTEN